MANVKKGAPDANRVTLAFDGVVGAEFGNATISNQESTPAVVRYGSRAYPRPLDGVNETAALYCRLDHADQQQVGIYGEITPTQADTWGSFLKGIHYGRGDFIFVGQFTAGGAAYEASSFADGTKGYISTVQADSLPNVTLFNALWEWPTVPNYGMFFAAEAPGHALTIQKFAGAADGQAQIRITEHDYGRHRYRVLNDGGIICESLAATAGAHTRNSPELRVRGAYWDGADSHDVDGLVKLVMETDGPLYGMYMYVGAPGAESLSCIYRPGALDMQLNTIQNVRYLDGYTAQVTIRSNAGGTVLADFDPTIAAEETALLLRCRDGDVYTLQRVTLGADDSGGAGYRCLRVPN